MRTIRGPAIFLAQFVGDEAPFDNIDGMARWAAGLGFAGIQVPTGNPRFIDLELAAASKGYCDELRGRVESAGVVITELSTHLQGQLVAVHPAYDALFDGFAPPELRGRPAARTEWATRQVRLAAIASRHLGLSAQATFSGAFREATQYRLILLLDGMFSVSDHLFTLPLDRFGGISNGSGFLSRLDFNGILSRDQILCQLHKAIRVFLDSSLSI